MNLKTTAYKMTNQRELKNLPTSSTSGGIGQKAYLNHQRNNEWLKHKMIGTSTCLNKGQLLKDDAGEMQVCPWSVHFNGNHHLQQHSLKIYKKFKQLKHPTALHFHRFLPDKLTFNGQMEANWLNRSYSLSGQQLTQKQLRWVLLRLFEFAAWIAKEGYVHAGLTPESIWIVPKTHGVIIGTFYHLTTKGKSLKTTSSKYQDWYPSDVLENNMASSQIDIQMIKNLAVYLLGAKDSFGINKGLKPLDPKWTDFILTFHHNAYECLRDYRKLFFNKINKQNYVRTKTHQI